MKFPVARGVDGAQPFNTIDMKTVKLFFQKSPGKPKGDARGIARLDFRVLAGGLTRTGRTPKTGEVQALLHAGKGQVELLVGSVAVATYDITADFGPLAPAAELLGQQQRLRHLGYQLGHGGTNEDGVGTVAVLDISPFPEVARDPERDSDDEELFDRKKKERKENKDIQEELFKDLTFRTERSILDFQADSGLFADARVGPNTRGKLVDAVGE